MFENDRKLFSFLGLGGLPITVGWSILLLVFLYASLSRGMNPDGLGVFAILILSTLLAGHVQAAFATLAGVKVEGIAIGGAGVQLSYSGDIDRKTELLTAAALPVAYLGVFSFLGLAANITAGIAGDYGAAGLIEQHQFWRRMTEIVWLAAAINFFVGMLHLMPSLPLAGGFLFREALESVLPEDKAKAVSGFAGLFVFLIWIPLGLAFLASGLALFLMAPSWERNRAVMNNEPGQ